MKPVEYAETAYDSTRPRALPPRDEGGAGVLDRAQRREPLRGRGVECREFLAGSHASLLVDEMRTMSDQRWQELHEEAERLTSLRLQWGTLKNPVVVLDAIAKLSIFFAIGGVFSTLLSLFYGPDIFDLQIIIFFVLPCFAIYFLSRTAIKRGWVKDRNNVVLNRCTGMVEFPWKGGRRSLPFDEFDPYVYTAVSPSGAGHYYLRLVHRYSPVSVGNPHSRYELWELERDWEYVQAFMDISRPIPDVPAWEIGRKVDPTSIEHDRRCGRPQDFWRRQDPEEVRRWEEASREALSRYPWGLRREEALAMGWRPSGYGDGERLWEKAGASAGERAAG